MYTYLYMYIYIGRYCTLARYLASCMWCTWTTRPADPSRPADLQTQWHADRVQPAKCFLGTVVSRKHAQGAEGSSETRPRWFTTCELEEEEERDRFIWSGPVLVCPDAVSHKLLWLNLIFVSFFWTNFTLLNRKTRTFAFEVFLTSKL